MEKCGEVPELHYSLVVSCSKITFYLSLSLSLYLLCARVTSFCNVSCHRSVSSNPPMPLPITTACHSQEAPYGLRVRHLRPRLRNENKTQCRKER